MDATPYLLLAASILSFELSRSFIFPISSWLIVASARVERATPGVSDQCSYHTELQGQSGPDGSRTRVQEYLLSSTSIFTAFLFIINQRKVNRN